MESIDEALAALAEHGGDARILAGGQSLIPAMRFRLARPALLVDINRLDELGATSARTAASCASERGRVTANWNAGRRSRPAIAMIGDASVVVADPVVRQMGTIVGSLCHDGVRPATGRSSHLRAGPRSSGRGPIYATVMFVRQFLLGENVSTAANEAQRP